MAQEPLSPLEQVSSGRRVSLVGPFERPVLVLIVALVIVFAVEMPLGGPARWGFSAHALRAGRIETILTHMFSHAGLSHLLFNLDALETFGPPIVRRLGANPDGLRRFALLFLLSGLCGAALFLALHPNGAAPMVGSSGAICGLWGACMRLPEEPGAPLAAWNSRPVLRQIRSFVGSNVVLFLILFAIVSLADGQGGLAWEAHLGGLVVGLFLFPAFDRRVVPVGQGDTI